MTNDTDPRIIVDEESYEGKAITDYLAGQMSATVLRKSLGVSRTHMYRLIERYRESGEHGLASKKYGNRNRARSEADREQILMAVREHYSDFGPTLACEKLREIHGIRLAVETLRKWMIAEGMWSGRAGRKPRVYSPRPPRERRGELVQIDGSYHRWFEKRGPEACLLVFIDDATSELMLLMLVDHESSYNYMLALRRYIEMHGRPLALFADRHSVFRATNAKDDGTRTPTQFARACGNLSIQIICAKTPQAKGRVERANRTLQDRLIKEMRLQNISTIEAANAFLEKYRLTHNQKFARPAVDPQDAHIPATNLILDSLLCYTVQRKVFKDLTISFNKVRYILEDNKISRRAIGKKVAVVLRLNGDLEILYEESALPYRTFDKIRRIVGVPNVVDHKRLGAALAWGQAITEVEPHHFQRNAHVVAGFRKHFKEPTDDTSYNLRNAPPEIRRKHNGRPRRRLDSHPVIILQSRIEELLKLREE